MQKCYERFLSSSTLLQKNAVRVVDIGGANVNGTYSDIFSDEKFEYIAVDLEKAEGVEVVLDDPYKLPFDDGAVDIVICGQVFEHVEFFWQLFEEMARILNHKGFVFLIVPSAGPIHQYPVDCYRFYPDSMKALSRYAGIPLIEFWHDDRGPWNDLVGVFAHRFEPVKGMRDLPVNRYMQTYAAAPLFEKGQQADVEKTAGRISYAVTLGHIHEKFQPRGYLEIGVRKGASLALASCPSVAIDPSPDLSQSLPGHQRLCEVTSDTFFDQHASTVLAGMHLDLVFIDGMHLFEFALRDFINAERWASGTTVVVIDDIFPNHPLQASRKRQSRVWTGDIWKLHHCLQVNRPDLLLMPLDTSPTGLLIVAGLDPSNRALSSQYNPLVREYRDMNFDSEEGRILSRSGAKQPDDPLFKDLLAHLRAARDKNGSAQLDPIRQRLRGFHQ